MLPFGWDLFSNHVCCVSELVRVFSRHYRSLTRLFCAISGPLKDHIHLHLDHLPPELVHERLPGISGKLHLPVPVLGFGHVPTL